MKEKPKVKKPKTNIFLTALKFITLKLSLNLKPNLLSTNIKNKIFTIIIEIQDNIKLLVKKSTIPKTITSNKLLKNIDLPTTSSLLFF